MMAIPAATATDGSTHSVPPLEHPLSEGWTLPASWYTDPAVYALEREQIFAASWQYACPVEWLAEEGAFSTMQAGHVPVVIVRGRDGELRGFVNVCRHRGHLVATGSGCRETLQCPYHAWTYDLDGTLRRAPRSEREPGFDAAHFSLLPVAVDTWGPFVFVSCAADPAPLASVLADIPARVEACGVDLSTLRFQSHHEWPSEVNWKVAIENYLECYHCAVAHPEFSKVIDVRPDEYQLLVEPTYTSQIGSVRASALDGNVAYDPRGEVTQSQFHHVWPNTTINIVPGPQNISIERWVPTGPTTMVEVTDYFFGADVPEQQIAEVLEFDNQVALEDLALVESVQKGLASGAVPQGRVMVQSERLLAAFHRRVHDALLG
jgi:phenylpropionate dioxygenase-like ring-hydroxylating dioxygenase large terminal subunit